MTEAAIATVRRSGLGSVSDAREPARTIDLAAIELMLWRMEHHMLRLIGHCERLMREKETLRLQNQWLMEELQLLRDDIDKAHRYIGLMAQRKSA